MTAGDWALAPRPQRRRQDHDAENGDRPPDAGPRRHPRRRHRRHRLPRRGLADQAVARCQGLSKGMRQEVALAGALIHEPDLIILDEPLTGLDAGSARQVKTVLREHVARRVTIIMTTHILDVAERMADCIGIIAEGRLISEGTLAELRATANAGSELGQVSLEDIFLASSQALMRRPHFRLTPIRRLVRSQRTPARLARLALDDDGGQAHPRAPHGGIRHSVRLGPALARHRSAARRPGPGTGAPRLEDRPRHGRSHRAPGVLHDALAGARVRHPRLLYPIRSRTHPLIPKTPSPSASWP
jgi:hypothetical protein